MPTNDFKPSDDQAACRRSPLDLSIIIVNWNTGGLLRACVDSILQHADLLSVEIIIVDNASTDDSLAGLSAADRVTVLHNTVNAGFAKANNQGFADANGRFLLMLNPDTVVLPGALTRMVAFMDQHPVVAALGPQLLNADGSLQPSCSYFPSLVGLLIESVGLNRLFPRCSLFARWLMTDWAHDRSRAVDQPSGACLLLRRSSLDRVGVLDERFFVYLEEVDLCYRLARSGATIIYLPSAQVIHYGGQSSIQNLDVRVVARYRSLLLYFQKHFPRWYVALVRLIIAFQMVLRITTLPLLRKRLSVASTGLRPGELAPYYLQVLRLSIAPSDRT